MDTHETRISLLENNIARTQLESAKSEGRIIEKIEEVKTAFLNHRHEVDDVIHGNGKAGLLERVSKMEGKVADIHECQEHDEDRADIVEKRLSEIERLHAREAGGREKSETLWTRITPFLPWIGAILGAAVMYLVGPKRG